MDDPTSDEDIINASEAPAPHPSTQKRGEELTTSFPTPKSGSKRHKGDADSIERQKLHLFQQVTSVLATPDPYSSFGHQKRVSDPEHLLEYDIADHNMASTKANAKLKALQEHDYGGPERMETNTRGTKNTLASPSKPPAPQKKSKPDDVVTAGAHAEDASNAAILAAIGTLQNMMQDFKAELKQNTLTIANIEKAARV
ncbi:unnamed protein product [Leuciscus chuanchicus]